MKKIFLLMLMILSFSTYSQTTLHNTKVKLKTVTEGSKSDSLIVRGSDNVLKYLKRSTFLDDYASQLWVSNQNYADLDLTNVFSGDISATNFIGNGSGLLNIDASTFNGNYTTDFVRSTGFSSQTITGDKTFTSTTFFNGYADFKNQVGFSEEAYFFNTNKDKCVLIENNLISFLNVNSGVLGSGLSIFTNNYTTRQIELPTQSGKIALTSELDNYILNDNGNSKNLVIDPLGTNSNLFNSIFTIKNNSTNTNTNVTSMLDVTRNNTTTSSNTTTASLIRNTNTSNFDNSAGIVAQNLVAKHSANSNVGWLYGALNSVQYDGSGNVGFMIPASNQLKINGSGVGTLNYVRGANGNININNPNTTANFVQASHPAIELEQGTINQSQLLFLDYDFNTSNLGTTLNLNGDFSYIQGGGGTDVIAAKNNLESNGHKFRFIHNEGNLQSDFGGLINVSRPIADYTNASGDVLIPKKYLDERLNVADDKYLRSDADDNISSNLTFDNDKRLFGKDTSGASHELAYVTTTDFAAFGSLTLPIRFQSNDINPKFRYNQQFFFDMYHSGNSNLSTVDWAAKDLNAFGLLKAKGLQEVLIDGNKGKIVLGTQHAGGASLEYDITGHLHITPRSGFSTKITSGNLLVDSGYIKATSYRVTNLNTAPTSATAGGTVGEIRYTADYIYICVAANTWKRSALTTW